MYILALMFIKTANIDLFKQFLRFIIAEKNYFRKEKQFISSWFYDKIK